MANQIALHEAETESSLVHRARAYIAGYYEDPKHPTHNATPRPER